MAIPKEVKNKETYIKWFSDLNKDSKKIAGGKGANLAEINKLDLQVPAGFIISSEAYDLFIEKAGIKDKINEILKNIDYEDIEKLDEASENIRAFIEDSKFPKELKKEILEAYENLDIPDLGMVDGSALDILKNSSEPIFVAVRSSSTTEDLDKASFAGQQETYLNVKGEDELFETIRKCFSSLFTPRAIYYRNKKDLEKEKIGMAVIVQKMIDSQKSGVIFSNDPIKKNENLVIESVWGLGEGLASGKITPDRYVTNRDLELIEEKVSIKRLAVTRDSSGEKAIVRLTEGRANQRVLKNHEIRKLAEAAIKLEEHFGSPQDIEFAIENEEVFFLQTRPITTLNDSKEMEGEISGDLVLSGFPASQGIASGKVKIIEDIEDLSKIKQGDVLVTKMTNPRMIVTMQKASAIVTDEGGTLSHAAIVAREIGLPCVVGTQEATTRLKESELVTIDGYNGNIYKGKTQEAVSQEPKEETFEEDIEDAIQAIEEEKEEYLGSKKEDKEEIQESEEEIQTNTNIRLILNPDSLDEAISTGIKNVGLLRMEKIIEKLERTPEDFLRENNLKGYEESLSQVLEKTTENFNDLWIRTSDIPNKEEPNPALGLHGIRYSLKNPELLKVELRAMKKLSEKGKKIGILIPQLILLKELQSVKELLREINFNPRLGTMIETPAAVQLIGDLCKEGIKFIAMGTNDLTQYLLAVDRTNPKVQDLYDEMHPAILYQLQYVIRVCKRNNVETSICGESASNEEMIKYLIGKGIDTISVEPKDTSRVRNLVKKFETEIVRGTDKEPRQYQPSKPEIKEEEEEEIPTIEPASSEDGLPEINGAENIQEETNEEDEKPEELEKKEAPQEEGETIEDVEEAIKAIEEEKEEYIDNLPEGEEEEESKEETPKEPEEDEELDIF